MIPYLKLLPFRQFLLILFSDSRTNDKIYYICHMEIHPKQRQLLNILSKNIDEPLTLEELRERLDISSRSLVLHHIRQLEKKKFML